MDSSSCLPADLLQKWNITVVPHELIIGLRSLRDGVDIQPSEFYRLLSEDSTTKFTTAAPQPRQFLDAFISASQQASNILCLTLSSQFSATYRSACAAATMSDGALTENPAGTTKIKVIDSKAAAGGAGLIALAAARWASQGLSLEQVVAGVERMSPKVNLLAYLDTLRYLSRSGRIHKMAAWAGTMLSIKQHPVETQLTDHLDDFSGRELDRHPVSRLARLDEPFHAILKFFPGLCHGPGKLRLLLEFRFVCNSLPIL